MTPLKYQYDYIYVHDTNPDSLSQLMSPRETTYTLRGKDILKVPKVNTARFKLNSWRYQAHKLWNSLPDVLRASSDFKTFRKLLANESLLYYLRIVLSIDFVNNFWWYFMCDNLILILIVNSFYTVLFSFISYSTYFICSGIPVN